MATPLYFVENDFGKIGRSFVELDRDTNSRAAVVALIVSGELNPIKILEVIEDENSCRDVTEDVAWEVAAIWSSVGEPLSFAQQDFIEQTIGVVAAKSFVRAA